MHSLRLTIVVLPLFVAITAVGEAKRATPPTAKDLIGVWIGFDVKNKWKGRLVLNPELRIQASNDETKRAIDAIQK
jgi:hypothetical protein